MNLNKVFLVGRLTKDAEYRQTQGGQGITTISLAVNRSWVDKSGMRKEDSQFFPVVFWGKQAEIIGKFCKRGDTLFVEGRVQNRRFVDKSGQERVITEVMGERFQFGQKASGGADRANSADLEDGLEDEVLPEDIESDEQVNF